MLGSKINHQGICLSKQAVGLASSLFLFAAIFAAPNLTSPLSAATTFQSRQQDDSDRDERFMRYTRALLEQYDANGDNKLDVEEMKKMRRPPNVNAGDDELVDFGELFNAVTGRVYSPNRSQSRSRNEPSKPKASLPESPQANSYRSQVQRYSEAIVKKHDTDKDGLLSADELSKMPRPPKINMAAGRKINAEELTNYLLALKDSTAPRQTAIQTPKRKQGSGTLMSAGPNITSGPGSKRVSPNLNPPPTSPNAPINVEAWLLRTNTDEASEYSFDGLSTKEMNRLMTLLSQDRAHSKLVHIKLNMRPTKPTKLTRSIQPLAFAGTPTGQRTSNRDPNLYLEATAIRSDNSFEVEFEMLHSIDLEQSIKGVASRQSAVERDQFSLSSSTICDADKSVSFASKDGHSHWVLVLVCNESNVSTAKK